MITRQEQNEIGGARPLSSILKTQKEAYFPIIGKNGYGGEQDGSHVVFLGILQVASMKEARKVYVGNAVKIHYATYSALLGWEISLGHWSTAKKSDCKVEIYTDLCWWK